MIDEYDRQPPPMEPAASRRHWREERDLSPLASAAIDADDDACDLDSAVEDEEENAPFRQFKEEVMLAFEAWLDELDEDEAADCLEAARSQSSEPDLETFFRELAALRQEVRLQSKANNNLGRDVRQLADSVGAGLENSVRSIANAVNDVKRQVPEARREAQRDGALELIAVVEGLERNLTGFDAISLPLFFWGAGAKEKLREQIRRPQELVLAKAHDAMRRLQITSVAAVGDEFDPKRMRAIGATVDGQARSGTVVEVCLQGYLMNESLLRTADVKVKK